MWGEYWCAGSFSICYFYVMGKDFLGYASQKKKLLSSQHKVCICKLLQSLKHNSLSQTQHTQIHTVHPHTPAVLKRRPIYSICAIRTWANFQNILETRKPTFKRWFMKTPWKIWTLNKCSKKSWESFAMFIKSLPQGNTQHMRTLWRQEC